MKQVDGTNIEEMLYELGGPYYVSANWFKRKWWDFKIAQRLRREKQFVKHTRKFLLQDIQGLRFTKFSDFVRLRFLNEDGTLVSAMFKTKWKNGKCHLNQYQKSVPIIASKPKGPMKFRKVECSQVKYTCLGLRRNPTWSIGFTSTL